MAVDDVTTWVCTDILNLVVSSDYGIRLENPFGIGIYSAIQLNLLMLNLSVDGLEESVKRVQNSIAEFFIKLLKSFERTFYSTAKESLNQAQLGDLEMKVLFTLFFCVGFVILFNFGNMYI